MKEVNPEAVHSGMSLREHLRAYARKGIDCYAVENDKAYITLSEDILEEGEYLMSLPDSVNSVEILLPDEQ